MGSHLLVLSDMLVQTVALTRLPNLTGFPYLGVRLWTLATLGSGAWLWRGGAGVLREESRPGYSVLHPQKKQ